MTFYYLATPYSKYKAGIDEAWQEACRQTALLVRAGVPIYSPIAHTHPIAMLGGIDPLDHSLWLEADRALMDSAIGLIVCEMQGWQESYGIGEEVKHFERAGKPIYMMEPGIVPCLLAPSQSPAGGGERAGKE